MSKPQVSLPTARTHIYTHRSHIKSTYVRRHTTETDRISDGVWVIVMSMTQLTEEIDNTLSQKAYNWWHFCQRYLVTAGKTDLSRNLVIDCDGARFVALVPRLWRFKPNSYEQLVELDYANEENTHVYKKPKRFSSDRYVPGQHEVFHHTVDAKQTARLLAESQHNHHYDGTFCIKFRLGAVMSPTGLKGCEPQLVTNSRQHLVPVTM